MADAANAFLNSLWPDQKAKVSYAFDDDERLSWHFVPTGANYKPGDRELRKGMPLGAMQPFQRELATALLAAGLSQQGVIKAQSIMSLEQVLLLLEGAKPVNRRDPTSLLYSALLRQRALGPIASRAITWPRTTPSLMGRLPTRLRSLGLTRPKSASDPVRDFASWRLKMTSATT
jgi:hypothetical protein